MLINEELLGKEKKENGREKKIRGEELTKGIHVENLCSI